MLLLRAADCGKTAPPSTNQLLQKTSLRISGLRFVSRYLCFTLVSTLELVPTLMIDDAETKMRTEAA
jgi:hypothetical protein